MRFFKTDDFYFFSENGLKEIKEYYRCHKLVKITRYESFLNEIENNPDIERTDFLCFCMPEILSPTLAGVEIIRLSNKYGLLTKEQHERGIDPFYVIESKLGAKVYKPSVTFDNYIIDKTTADFKQLMTQIRMIQVKRRSGLPLKGFFLTGVPGTGKTFFAKCVAGELNRSLIHLNLSIFINAPDTFGLLDSFFDFFKYNDGAYIVLIDEIEKMLTGNNPKTKQVLGYLLTALNDFGERDYKAEVFFIATANNITDLARENPELFRKGRFDMSIYLTAPKRTKAIETFKFYESLCNKKFVKKSLPYFAELAYKSITENAPIPFEKNSLARKIVGELVENNEILRMANELELGDFLKQSTPYLNYYKDNIKFMLDIDRITTEVYLLFSDILVDKKLFAYVPAEIETMTSELYSLFLFDPQPIDYKEYFEKNIPIQIAMKDGILEMNSATQNFVKF